MLRSVILAAARSQHAGRLAEAVPLTRGMAFRFIAGESVEDVLETTSEAVSNGRCVTVEALVEDAVTLEDAVGALKEYQRLLGGLSSHELTPAAEITVNLAAIGLLVDNDLAWEHAVAICEKASEAGTTVTLGARDYGGTDSNLEILERLRTGFPTTGIMLQSSLRRTEADCQDLAVVGARVRLCQSVTAEPESVAYQSRLDIDRSYVRCLNILMSAGAYPMIATHDARLIAIAEDRAKWFNRTKEQFEFHMLHGRRENEQQRLVDAGYTVRTYLPYGRQWYSFMMRRLANRPSTIDSVVRIVRPQT